jgi:nitric oxide reductase subunit C
MLKIAAFSILFTVYAVYSFTVYTKGTELSLSVTPAEKAMINKGKELFQQYNCIACHQVYGLGGYLGPELTTAYSDPHRGEIYMKTFLMAGGPRMPNYHFTNEEVNSIISYLKYVDATAVTYKK